MAKINLAQQLATTLEQAGIKRIWGLTGDSLNGLTDALRTMDSIEWMHVRHEGGRRVRRRCRSRRHRRVGGVRRQLRAGESAFDQRPVRLPSQPCTGVGHRRTNPVFRNRLELLSGKPTPRNCSKSAATSSNW